MVGVWIAIDGQHRVRIAPDLPGIAGCGVDLGAQEAGAKSVPQRLEAFGWRQAIACETISAHQERIGRVVCEIDNLLQVGGA
jgi:hypothetical protein